MPPSCTAKIGNIRLWDQNSADIQWERQTYPPTCGQKNIQKVVGEFIYYARVHEPTIQVALGKLEEGKPNGTEDTKEGVAHLLD